MGVEPPLKSWLTQLSSAVLRYADLQACIDHVKEIAKHWDVKCDLALSFPEDLRPEGERNALRWDWDLLGMLWEVSLLHLDFEAAIELLRDVISRRLNAEQNAPPSDVPPKLFMTCKDLRQVYEEYHANTTQVMSDDIRAHCGVTADEIKAGGMKPELDIEWAFDVLLLLDQTRKYYTTVSLLRSDMTTAVQQRRLTSTETGASDSRMVEASDLQSILDAREWESDAPYRLVTAYNLQFDIRDIFHDWIYPVMSDEEWQVWLRPFLASGSRRVRR